MMILMLMTMLMRMLMMIWLVRFKGDRRQTLPALSTRAISMDTLDHSASQVIMMMINMMMIKMIMMMIKMIKMMMKRRMRMKVKG